MIDTEPCAVERLELMRAAKHLRFFVGFVAFVKNFLAFGIEFDYEHVYVANRSAF